MLVRLSSQKTTISLPPIHHLCSVGSEYLPWARYSGSPMTVWVIKLTYAVVCSRLSMLTYEVSMLDIIYFMTKYVDICYDITFFFITHTHSNLNKKYLILIFYSFYDLMGASVGVPCNAPWPWCMPAVLMYPMWPILCQWLAIWMPRSSSQLCRHHINDDDICKDIMDGYLQLKEICIFIP